jgi:hypothetical protein
MRLIADLSDQDLVDSCNQLQLAKMTELAKRNLLLK